MPESLPEKEISLKGSLLVDRAKEIKETLSKALQQSDSVLVDLSSAADIDLACIQTLYAAKRTAEKKGISFSFTLSIPEHIMKKLTKSGFLRKALGNAEELGSSLVGFIGSGE
jgi:anti-anti-sigma regulatory factor